MGKWSWSILVAATWLAAPPARAEQDTAIQAVVSGLDRALQTKDEVLAKAHFTPEGWEGGDSGARLYRQGIHKGFHLRLARADVKGERAVAVVDISRGERVVDRVFLYLVRQGAMWKAGGLDETEDHPAFFLDGTLPAAFQVNTLPSSPAQEALAKQLILAAKGGEPERRALAAAGLETEALVPYLKRVEALGEPQLVEVRVAERLGRAAWLLRSNPDAPGATPELLALYLLREGQRWRLVDFTYGGFSARSFLRAKLR